MKISASRARQHFAALLERAMAGEEIEIERHGRLIARLLPVRGRERAGGAPEATGAAEVRGVAPRSALAKVLRERALRRLAIARPRAESALAQLARHGVKARLVGSLARGSFRHTSDVDILVEDPGALRAAAIEEIIRREMEDFPFDVLYADRLPEALRRHIVRGP